MTKPRRDHFADPYRVQGTTTLRFLFAPERDEEVIDPVTLSSASFLRRLYELGHGGAVRLFSYERPKTAAVENDHLVIVQTDAHGRHGEGEHVRVQVAESGEIVIDANVTGRVRRGAAPMGFEGFVVSTDDIETVLRLCFAFAAAVYDDIDRFKRHQRFQYEAALVGLDYRTIERNPQARTFHQMSMRSRGEVIRAFDEPRMVARNELPAAANEIQRTIVMLTRRAGE